MKRVLDVFLHNRYIGQYIQTESGLSEFMYDAKYRSAADALPMSQSLPLRSAPFTYQECHGFFAGILPEGENRNIIARNLGISANNDFSMLDLIGGECAGAITFMPPGHTPPAQEEHYRKLSGQQVKKILEDLPLRPLLAGREGIRLSLAGAQDKLAVYVSGQDISLPILNAPSTHVFKPAIEPYKSIVENEAFCMTLAKKLGMNVAEVEVRSEGEKKFLLVERYDRTKTDDESGLITRLHQEDFCQALGIAPEKKYEAEGGVSIQQSFDLLRKVATTPLTDIRALLDAIIFNFLIGNHDAHGKNFSLLYHITDSGYHVQLAPLYDLICTTAYPNLDKKMAMSIGGKFKSEEITPQHFDRMADEAGLAKVLVRNRIREMAESILNLLDQTGEDTSVLSEVMTIIRGNAVRILDKLKG